MPRDRFNKLTQYLRINNKIQNDDMLQTHLKQEDMQKGEEQLTCLKPTLFTRKTQYKKCVTLPTLSVNQFIYMGSNQEIHHQRFTTKRHDRPNPKHKIQSHNTLHVSNPY